MKREPFWLVISFSNKKNFEDAIDNIERIAQSVAFFKDGYGPIRLYAVETDKLIYIYTMHVIFIERLRNYDVRPCYTVPKLGDLEPYWELPYED